MGRKKQPYRERYHRRKDTRKYIPKEYTVYNSDLEEDADTDEIEEENAFINLCADMDTVAPWQLQYWKRHFTTRASFLAEANRWAANLLMDGPSIPIITDVASGGKTFTQLEAERIKQDTQDYWNDLDEREFMASPKYPGLDEKPTSTWKPGIGYLGSHHGNPNHFQRHYGKPLPLIPKIAAPSGMSSIKLMVM